jgi:hypothetical protein
MILSIHELKIIGVAVMIEVVKNSDLTNQLSISFPEFASQVGVLKGSDEYKPALIRFFNDRRDEVSEFLELQIKTNAFVARLANFYWQRFISGPEFANAENAMTKAGPDMWLSLHFFAIEWNGNIQEASSFLSNFAKQIPCGICREHWNSLCAQTPPVMDSQSTFFEWSVAAHNKVNARLGKKLMSVADAYVKYKVSGYDFFDEVYVINLDRRPDRMKDFEQEIARVNWPLKQPVRFRAIDAEAVPVPYGWNSGGGAWGCMQSHRQILERVMMNKSDSVLIFEDDAIFAENFRVKLLEFLNNVPRPWDKIMLGGQLFDGSSKSERVNQHVRKVVNCQRTHAYAVRGEFMRALYQKWHSSYGHCDHIMGPFQDGWNVYAPTEFLVGQGESRSDISGSHNPAKFWEPPKDGRVFWLNGFTKEDAEKVCSGKYHRGRNLQNGVDIGLASIVDSQKNDTSVAVTRLRSWISMIQWEGRSMRPEHQCAIWCPNLKEEIIRAACGNNLVILSPENK